MWCLVAIAHALDPAVLQVKLAETQAWRAQRIAEVRPEIPQSAYALATTGKVATGIHKVGDHAAKLGYGVGILDVPIQTLWAALNDDLHHVDILPLSRIELVSGQPCKSGRDVLMVLPLPLMADRFWVNQTRYAQDLEDHTRGRMRELVWNSVDDPEAILNEASKEAVKGMVPMTFNKGAWLLIAINDSQTLAEYHSWVDPGGNIPVAAASAFATSGIVDTFEAMETYAKSGASKCFTEP